jgi:hypothetical protein
MKNATVKARSGGERRVSARDVRKVTMVCGCEHSEWCGPADGVCRVHCASSRDKRLSMHILLEAMMFGEGRKTRILRREPESFYGALQQRVSYNFKHQASEIRPHECSRLCMRLPYSMIKKQVQCKCCSSGLRSGLRRRTSSWISNKPRTSIVVTRYQTHRSGYRVLVKVRSGFLVWSRSISGPALLVS